MLEYKHPCSSPSVHEHIAELSTVDSIYCYNRK